MKKIIACYFIILGLSGCGGGGGSDAKPVPDTVGAVAPPSTTLLKDNPAAANAQFSQFKNHELTLSVQEYGFSANEVFVKVYTSSEQVLFLGKISGDNNLSVYVPKTTSVVWVDLFSTVSGDPQITKEFSL